MQDNTVAHSFIFKNDADEWMKCLISSAAVSKVFFPVPLHEPAPSDHFYCYLSG